MKTLSAFLLFSLLPIFLAAQSAPPGCDGIRYIDAIFSSTQVSTVQYGMNLNNGAPEALIMDVYEPEGDTLAARPVIILAHGGYYLFGDRTLMADLCIDFAKRGYVAATIDYRKLPGGTVLDSVNAVEAIVRTMQDLKAAVRFFREDRATDNLYRIHSDFIVAGGYSAGAITALHTAYWDSTDVLPPYMQSIVTAEGGLTGASSANLGYSSAIQGAINQSGALIFKELIDAGESPVVSYHGVADNIVPIGHGVAGGALVTDGSQEIHNRAEALGIVNYFQPVSGGSHTNIFGGLFLNQYQNFIDSAAATLEELYCALIYTDLNEVKSADHRLVLSPNPFSDKITISADLPGNGQIWVVDQLGRIAGRQRLFSGANDVDLHFLSPGVYTLIVWNEQVALRSRVVKFR